MVEVRITCTQAQYGQVQNQRVKSETVTLVLTMAMCHSFQNFLGMMALLSVHRWQAVDGAETYILDDSTGVGRVFDGIGGISGGGVNFSPFVFVHSMRMFN